MFSSFSKHPAYAWAIWLLSALFMFYKYALEVSPSVMTKDLMAAFHIDGAELGNLAATYFYSYLIMQIPAGILLDKFGPRNMTTIAMALCAGGAILFANANTVFLACVGRFLTGAGASFAALNCLKLVANWFPPKRFALMAGLMMTVGMLGAVGGQAPLSAFISYLGWRSAIEAIAWIGVALVILFWLVVRDAPKHQEHILKAKDVKRIVDGGKQIVKNKQCWWVSIYSGLAFAPVSVFGGLWGVPFLAQYYNLSHTKSAHEVSLIFIGFAIGAPLTGWLSDRIGKRKVVMFTGTIISLFIISFVLLSPPLPLNVLSTLLLFFGITISAFLLSFTMIREINAPIMAATAVGFMNTFNALLGAVSDPMTGKFLDLGWQGAMEGGARVFPTETYRLALLTLPAYLVIALIVMLFIRETFCKPQYPASLP